MAVTIIHRCDRLFSWDEVAAIRRKAELLPNFRSFLFAAEAQSFFELKFNGRIPEPPPASSIELETVHFFGELKARWSEAESLIEEMVAFSRSPDSHRAFTAVGVGARPRDSAVKQARISVTVPIDADRTLKLGWQNMSCTEASRICEAILLPYRGRCTATATALEVQMMGRSVTIQEKPANRGGSFGFIRLPSEPEWSLSMLVSAFEQTGCLLKSLDWSVFWMASDYAPSSPELHSAWNALAAILSKPGKGTINLDYQLTELEALELIRTALTGDKSYATVIGQFERGDGEIPSLVARAITGGYRIEIHCKVEDEALLRGRRRHSWSLVYHD